MPTQIHCQKCGARIFFVSVEDALLVLEDPQCAVCQWYALTLDHQPEPAVPWTLTADDRAWLAAWKIAP